MYRLYRYLMFLFSLIRTMNFYSYKLPVESLSLGHLLDLFLLGLWKLLFDSLPVVPSFPSSYKVSLPSLGAIIHDTHQFMSLQFILFVTFIGHLIHESTVTPGISLYEVTTLTQCHLVLS